ncbi:hypothetical protein EJB05_19511, partial [Eragrostis curvula]
MLSLPTASLPPHSPPPHATAAADTSVSLLRGAAARRDAALTSALHAALLKSGALHPPQPLTASNSLLHAYLQCGLLSRALRLLDQTPRRDAATYTSFISAHCRLGAPLDAFRAFLDMLAWDAAGQGEDGGAHPNEVTAAALLQACGLARDGRLGRMVHGYLVAAGFCRDPFVVGSLVNMYAKVGDVVSAQRLVFGLPSRDVVSWTAIISGCVLNGMHAEALEVFIMMLEDGVLPNNVTMLSVIQACSLMGASELFGPVHTLVVLLELQDDASVVNSLILMYAKNGFVEEAMRLLEGLYLRRGNVCSSDDVLAAVLYGCTISGLPKNGEGIHGHLIKIGAFPTISIENPLMGMYARFEQVDAAQLVFNGMEVKDIVSWNTIISCLAKSGRVNEALELFSALHAGSGGLTPDFVTVLSVVQACSNAGLLKQGQMLHGYIVKSGFLYDVSICNALISMYAKLGRIDFAEMIFDRMDTKDLVSWNSMINAYGIHGDGHSALRIFHQLKDAGTPAPNAITFDAAKVRTEMRSVGLRKETGWSFVDVGGVDGFKFVAADSRHRDAEQIYEVWHSMNNHMADLAADVHQLSPAGVF